VEGGKREVKLTTLLKNHLFQIMKKLVKNELGGGGEVYNAREGNQEKPTRRAKIQWEGEAYEFVRKGSSGMGWI